MGPGWAHLTMVGQFRRLTTVAVTFCVIAGLGACATRPEQAADGCAAYAAYQGHAGTTVSIYAGIRDVEGDNLVRAWEQFEACSGIAIDYHGSDTFETRVPALARAGRAPDLAIFPQPGLITELAREGLLKPAAPAVQENARKGWAADWLRYGTVDGKLYAAPMDANVKSLVWYSPRWFKAHGYAVPTTWQEMLTLSERIAADGVKPWCAAIQSGVATGWPATDWLEDVLLRTAGSGVYDDWVAHRIPFNDPRVVAALAMVGQILKNPRYVNGGYGGVKSIATIAYQEGGLPILEGKCAMHRQASFYSNWWPASASVGPNEDIYAFYLPTMTPPTAAAPRPVLGAGTFVGAFSDRPEVTAVAAYLATAHFANQHARLGQAISANRGLDPASLTLPVARYSAELLADPNVTFRFDGSDLMPASVGSGTFWRAITEWIKGRGDADTLAYVERSWPR